MTVTVTDTRTEHPRAQWVRTTTSEGPLPGCPSWCQVHVVDVYELDPAAPTISHVRRFSGDDLPLGAVAVERLEYLGSDDGLPRVEVDLAVIELEFLTGAQCRSLAAALLKAAEWADSVGHDDEAGR